MKIKFEACNFYHKTTTVGAPIWECEPGAAFARYELRAGVTLRRLYWQPRNRRLIAEIYSIWDNGKGRCKGMQFHEIAFEDIAKFSAIHHTIEDALVKLGFLAQILN